MAYIRTNKESAGINPASPTLVSGTSITGLTVGKHYAVGGGFGAGMSPSITGATDVVIGQGSSLGSGYTGNLVVFKATATTVTFAGRCDGTYCQLD